MRGLIMTLLSIDGAGLCAGRDRVRLVTIPNKSPAKTTVTTV